MVGALDAADEFVNLFNMPESIAAIRLTTTGRPKKPRSTQSLEASKNDIEETRLDIGRPT